MTEPLAASLINRCEVVKGQRSKSEKWHQSHCCCFFIVKVTLRPMLLPSRFSALEGGCKGNWSVSLITVTCPPHTANHRAVSALLAVTGGVEVMTSLQRPQSTSQTRAGWCEQQQQVSHQALLMVHTDSCLFRRTSSCQRNKRRAAREKLCSLRLF